MRGAELVAEERETISRQLAAGDSFRDIGKLLNRSHSVVSREVKRNGGRSVYRAVSAQQRADEQRARPKPRLLEANTVLHDVVKAGLVASADQQAVAGGLSRRRYYACVARDDL